MADWWRVGGVPQTAVVKHRLSHLVRAATVAGLLAVPASAEEVRWSSADPRGEVDGFSPAPQRPPNRARHR